MELKDILRKMNEKKEQVKRKLNIKQLFKYNTFKKSIAKKNKNL